MVFHGLPQAFQIVQVIFETHGEKEEGNHYSCCYMERQRAVTCFIAFKPTFFILAGVCGQDSTNNTALKCFVAWCTQMCYPEHSQGPVLCRTGAGCMKSQCFKRLSSPARNAGLGDMAEALLLSEAKLTNRAAGEHLAPS